VLATVRPKSEENMPYVRERRERERRGEKIEERERMDNKLRVEVMWGARGEEERKRRDGEVESRG
jgi:hypothetical protein